MPTHITWYECDHCGKQFDAYAEAEACEWTHELVREDAA